MKRLRGSVIAIGIAVMALAGASCVRSDGAADAYVPTEGQDGKDVVWIPTPPTVVERMLDMAGLEAGDRLVDLGSGDGITVIAAARRGARAHGIEFNPELVALSRRNAQAAGVAGLATFEQGDIFESDFRDATVVTLFLLPSLNLQLRPTLLDMAPGTRIVSNSFDMGDWHYDDIAEATEDCTTYCEVMLWLVPARVDGRWELDGRPLQLAQEFQTFDGVLGEGGATRSVSSGRLEGTRIRFLVGDDEYIGEVDGDTMHGTINGALPWQATRRSGS